jgi:hypothetical protein
MTCVPKYVLWQIHHDNSAPVGFMALLVLLEANEASTDLVTFIPI